MAKTDLKNVLVRFSRFQVQAPKYLSHLGEIQFSFLFRSLPLDYSDVLKNLKILLDIISFELAVASSRHCGLKRIFCRMLDGI